MNFMDMWLRAATEATALREQLAHLEQESLVIMPS